MTAKKTTTQAKTDDAFKGVEDAVNASKETVETVVKAGTEAATKNYEKAFSMSKEQVEKASKTLFANYDELAVISKENMDAVVASGTAFAKGYETLGKELMAFSQGQMEANMNAAKAIFGAKSVREAIDAQNEVARQAFDQFVAESAKVTEMSMKVANEAYEPLQTRVNLTVEKIMKPVAA